MMCAMAANGGTRTMIFGREPAVFYTLLASVISLISGLGVAGIDLTTEQQGAVNAAVTLAAGCVIAWHVAAEKGIALLGGVAKALIAVALAFGVQLASDVQSSILLLTNLAIGLVVRSQVDAPVPPVGRPVEVLEPLIVDPVAGGRHEMGDRE